MTIHLKRETIYWIVALMIPFLFVSCGTSKWSMSPEYLGEWASEPGGVVVRTEPERMKFEFTKDSAAFSLNIHEDKTADGTIGSATFKNAVIQKNGGNPERTGIIYIVQCGEVGKIFPRDPLDSKEVEIWLSPIAGDSMEAELRYTKGWAAFPMAGMVFRKTE